MEHGISWQLRNATNKREISGFEPGALNQAAIWNGRLVISYKFGKKTVTYKYDPINGTLTDGRIWIGTADFRTIAYLYGKAILVDEIKDKLFDYDIPESDIK